MKDEIEAVGAGYCRESGGKMTFCDEGAYVEWVMEQMRAAGEREGRARAVRELGERAMKAWRTGFGAGLSAGLTLAGLGWLLWQLM